MQAIPSVAELGSQDQLRVLLLSQFSFFLLLVPTMVAISFATFSIVEEKLSGSLEPLLATPVRTGELLLGKALSGSALALIATWLCAGVFVGATVAMGWGGLLHLVLGPAWFISLFLITPANRGVELPAGSDRIIQSQGCQERPERSGVGSTTGVRLDRGSGDGSSMVRAVGSGRLGAGHSGS